MTERRSGRDRRRGGDPRAGPSVALRLVAAGPWIAAVAVGTVPSLLPTVAAARPVTIGVFFLTAVIRIAAAALSRPTGR